MFRTALIVPLLSLICSPTPAAGQGSAGSSRPLTVVSAGPSGEVASLAEANEVRVVFSEPMVTLGRIPSPVRAPFFRIAPSVPGTFRWSGTTILIFTPDPKKPLPFATRYDVTIDSSAVAVSGRRLEQPHTFSFTTPTVKLLQTHWYRRDGRAGAQMVILLRFNQRVRPTDVLSHVTAAFERHDWAPPVLPASTEAQLRQIDPQAPAAFNAKVAATRAIAESNAPVSIRLTNDWDKKKFPPAPTLLAFETTTVVPPESRVRLRIDERVPSPAGRAVPASDQQFTIEVEKAFFIDGFRCSTRMRSRRVESGPHAERRQGRGVCEGREGDWI